MTVTAPVLDAPVTVPAPPPLVNVYGVELIHTGQWDISTGTWTATPEDLQAAVAALDCPAIHRPHLKIGHVDPRFDGEPTFGWVSNLHVEQGRTLVGDYMGVPAWLAAKDDAGNSVLSSAWPHRSIEGLYDYRCQIGHVHPFVLEAVALLGVTPPGVGTLQSLQDVAIAYGVTADGGVVDRGIRIAVRVPARPTGQVTDIPLTASTTAVARPARPVRASWDESEHPRWEDGRFADVVDMLKFDLSRGASAEITTFETGHVGLEVRQKNLEERVMLTADEADELIDILSSDTPDLVIDLDDGSELDMFAQARTFHIGSGGGDYIKVNRTDVPKLVEQLVAARDSFEARDVQTGDDAAPDGDGDTEPATGGDPDTGGGYTGPRFEMPADVDEGAVAALRERWKYGRATADLETFEHFQDDPDLEDLIRRVGPTVATRIAWEADNQAALAEFVQRARPEDQDDDAPATDAELDEAKARAAEQLREDFAGKKVAVRVTEETLDRIVADGRFKTQFETKRSGGGYVPTKRAALESMMFGLPANADPATRPIYGYVAIEGIGPVRTSQDLLNTYGQVQVVLKDSVRSRTTASVGDSLDRKVLPSPIDDPSWESFNPAYHWSKYDFDYADHRAVLYPEAQVHGGVTVDDVEEVVFSVQPSEATQKALADKGISWRVLSPTVDARRGRRLRAAVDRAALVVEAVRGDGALMVVNGEAAAVVLPSGEVTYLVKDSVYARGGWDPAPEGTAVPSTVDVDVLAEVRARAEETVVLVDTAGETVAAGRRVSAAWLESEHPRHDNGRFADVLDVFRFDLSRGASAEATLFETGHVGLELRQGDVEARIMLSASETDELIDELRGDLDNGGIDTGESWLNLKADGDDLYITTSEFDDGDAVIVDQIDAQALADRLDVVRARYEGEEPDDEDSDAAPSGLVATGKDKLKVGSRIRLGPGEAVAGSERVQVGNEYNDVLLALLDTPDGAELRVGIVNEENDGRWRASNTGTTVRLDTTGMAQLRTAVDEMAAAGKEGEAREAALWSQIENLDARRLELLEKKWPTLSHEEARVAEERDSLDVAEEVEQLDRQIAEIDAQITQLQSEQTAAVGALPSRERVEWDRIDAEIVRLSTERSGIWADYWAGGTKDDNLYRRARDIDFQVEDLMALQRELLDVVAPGEGQRYHAREEELDRLERERYRPVGRREALTVEPALSEQDAAELVGISAERDRLDAEHSQLIDEEELLAGVVPGQWGDLVYRVVMTDTQQADYAIAVRPVDMGPDWDISDATGNELEASFNGAVDLRKLAKALDTLTALVDISGVTAARPRARRLFAAFDRSVHAVWLESEHPRHRHNGQFAEVVDVQRLDLSRGSTLDTTVFDEGSTGLELTQSAAQARIMLPASAVRELVAGLRADQPGAFVHATNGNTLEVAVDGDTATIATGDSDPIEFDASDLPVIADRLDRGTEAVDELGLAGLAGLTGDDWLVASSAVQGEDGRINLALAMVDGKPQLRLAPLGDVLSRSWRARDDGSTAILNPKAMQALHARVDKLAAQAQRERTEYDTFIDQMEALEDRVYEGDAAVDAEYAALDNQAAKIANRKEVTAKVKGTDWGDVHLELHNIDDGGHLNLGVAFQGADYAHEYASLDPTQANALADRLAAMLDFADRAAAGDIERPPPPPPPPWGGPGDQLGLRGAVDFVLPLDFGRGSDITGEVNVFDNGHFGLAVDDSTTGGKLRVLLSPDDAKAVSDAMYEMWRERDGEPDHDHGGLIADTTVETQYGQVYVAIREYVIDDDEDNYEAVPVLTLANWEPGLAIDDSTVTLADFDNTVALDEDALDVLGPQLEDLESYQPPGVEQVGFNADFDAVLRADNTVALVEGDDPDSPVAVVTVEQATGVLDGLRHLSGIDLPEPTDGEPRPVDGYGVDDDVSIDLYSDGSYVLTYDDGAGQVGLEIGSDVEDMIAGLEALLAADGSREPEPTNAAHPPRRKSMPTPAPMRVAANVSTEDIRREYYDSAPWSMWIVEMHIDPLQLIVCDDHSGKHYRVPVTLTGEAFTFGQPTEVAVEYVDKATYDAQPAAAAKRLVFASRRDSRPAARPARATATPPSRVRRAEAKAVASHTTATSTDSWDAAANVKRLPDGVTAATLRKVYAWNDPDGDPDTLAAYRLPHHEVGEDGTPGAANVKACQSAIGNLNGAQGGVNIPEADRQAVYNHLAKHLRDADVDPPELVSAAVARIRARRAAASTTPPEPRKAGVRARRLPQPRANTAVPAAEPEPTQPNEEDTVSDLSEFRSRLGLPDTADEAAVLAAIDALKGTNTDPPTGTTPDNGGEPAALVTLPPDAQAELSRMSQELADIRAEKAATVKAALFDGAVRAGKIRPADRGDWEARYDKAPEVVTEVLGAIAAGSAVPVAQAGHTGEPEGNAGEDAAFDRLFPPAATRTPVGAGTASKEV